MHRPRQDGGTRKRQPTGKREIRLRLFRQANEMHGRPSVLLLQKMRRFSGRLQNAAKWEATDEKETVDDAGALEMAGSGVWVMAGVSVGVAVAVGVGVAVGTGSNVTARV